MSRAYSVKNIYDAKFDIMPFENEWRDAIGCPQYSGTTIIMGPPKNGKTSFAMKWSKQLARFGRVLYHPVEEKLSLSIKEQLERVEMIDVGSKFIMTNGDDSVDELITRLDKHCSPNFIVIDSIQFWDLRWADYKRLKQRFPNKRFTYVSHLKGNLPEGITAERIWKDADSIFRVEGFKAFPTGRYGGGEPITINERLANEYWGLSK